MNAAEASGCVAGSELEGGEKKRPLPQPRPKTLAEQLENLRVIESAVGTDYPHTRPPELPAKVRVARMSSTDPMTLEGTNCSAFHLSLFFCHI